MINNFAFIICWLRIESSEGQLGNSVWCLPQH